MATLEQEKTQTLTQSQEAQLHNAGINERYRRLRDAVERQFGESNATDYTVRASVLAPEKPVFTAPVVENTPAVEQAPVVTEYVRTYAESPVFTTEKFGAVAEESPVAVQTPVQAVAVSVEAQYSLSHMAKMVLATFLAVVTVMLAVICVNTHLINQKTLQLQTLEARNAELVEENTEIQNRIAKARSEEAIRDYAISQGMIEGNR